MAPPHLSDMDVAGADLKHHLGRTHRAFRDLRYPSSPSFSFGRRSKDELNTLSTIRPFFCKNGTHRCPQGEVLLNGGRRDDKMLESLKSSGHQYKSVPGPGAYRIPRAMGRIENRREEMALSDINLSGRTATWRMPMSKRPSVYHTLGGSGHTHEHEGRLRLPTPRNLSPGPGRYYQHCDSCPSLFSDYHRPQGIPTA
mmetsp:Transcript_15741/g.25096  ORF Transcript_15741/g.25096 Transcript_15741/m.25096 type:complete len:198 (+) Transcript_15741:67-660(+)